MRWFCIPLVIEKKTIIEVNKRLIHIRALFVKIALKFIEYLDKTGVATCQLNPNTLTINAIYLNKPLFKNISDNKQVLTNDL
jgi:hypothetical protein